MKMLIITTTLVLSCICLYGQVTWKRTFGGTEEDWGTSIISTPDGGFVLTGSTESNDGDFNSVNKGSEDIFIVKLDSSGNVQWKKVFGGNESDRGSSISKTQDGGFVLTGMTSSNDGDFKGMNRGSLDIFLIKFDSSGNVLWKKTFGGSRLDEGHSITTTPDGGYVLTGRTESNDGDFEGMRKGYDDVFVIKLDMQGTPQWTTTIGGSNSDEGRCVVSTLDGGIVLTGKSSSIDGDFDGFNHGSGDIFIVKMDDDGVLQWKTRMEGNLSNVGTSLAISSKQGIVLTGKTLENYDEDNDVSRDVMVVHLNEYGSVQWKKMFGGDMHDEGYSITSTPDGGFVLTGMTSSNDGDFKGMNRGFKDILVMKLDSNGKLQSKSKKSKKK